MGWHARLSLDLRLEAGRSVARFEHEGPLRILQSLYPEGDAICHNVLIHPPGGLVGGDTLEIDVRAARGSHGLITTPGATRFYRSEGEAAVQRTRIALDEGARLEWLPLEAICYSACKAENHLRIECAPGAELIGWDISALGLPGANQPFASGSLLQHIELPGVWLERGRIDAADTRLLQSPLGLAGQRCMASLFFVAGSDLPRPARAALDWRARSSPPTRCGDGGRPAPGPRVVAVRVLAPLVEPALDLLKAMRNAWRPALVEFAGNTAADLGALAVERRWAHRRRVGPACKSRPTSSERQRAPRSGVLSGTAELIPDCIHITRIQGVQHDPHRMAAREKASYRSEWPPCWR